MSKTKLFIDALPLAQTRMSGIGHMILELTKALSKKDELDIHLIVPLRKRKLVERHGIKNVSIKTFPLPARAISILMRTRLLPPVDILLGRGVYLFPNYRNWPLLWSKSFTYFHDAAFVLHPETVSPKNLKYLQNNASLWLKRSDNVLTLTESSKKEISDSLPVPPEKLSVIPCGVDSEIFYTRPAEEISAVKNKYGINAQDYILYVGNLEPRKNVDNLLLAYESLESKLKNRYSLVLIGGGGWLNESTMELIDKLIGKGLNIIHPKSYVEDADLPAIYSGASLLVHPAIYEGFGIPPLQAMACKVPVAVSDIPSMREVVDYAGLFFDPGSTKDIARTIEQGLSDQKLRQDIISRGEARTLLFSWDQSAYELARLIRGDRMN